MAIKMRVGLQENSSPQRHERGRRHQSDHRSHSGHQMIHHLGRICSQLHVDLQQSAGVASPSGGIGADHFFVNGSVVGPVSLVGLTVGPEYVDRGVQ